MYLTDESLLVYVLDLPDPGTAVIENVATCAIECHRVEILDGWRIVTASDA